MLSPRIKLAIKVCIAVVIAYSIALYMNWEKPYWAAWTACSISFATRGQGFQTGVMRLCGGVTGMCIGFILLAFFIQERWLFIAFLSLWAGFCTYLAQGSKRHSYFWQQVGFFGTVVALSSGFDPVNAFEVGIERAQETGAGLLTFIVVGALIWPENSSSKLEQTSAKLIECVRQLWGHNITLLAGTAPAVYALRDQILTLKAQTAGLLNSAETDSWEVAEKRSAWRSFDARLEALGKTLVHWHSELDELQRQNFARLAPGLSLFQEEIDWRLQEVARMIAGQTPTRMPSPINLELDKKALLSLAHFDRLSMTAQRDRMLEVAALTQALFESVCEIREFDYTGAEKVSEMPSRGSLQLPAGRFALDMDNFYESIRVAASIWLMFLVIVYIPGVPAGIGALGIATRLAIADSSRPTASIVLLFAPALLAMASVSPFYFLLMPQLSSYIQLALAMSVAIFTIVYVFHRPQQAIQRTLFAYLFFTLIGLTNEQTYSFSHYSTTVTMWLLVLTVVAIAEYFPVSRQPQTVFLHLLNRYFRSCEFLLRQGLQGQHQRGFIRRLRRRFHTYEVVTLPRKLTLWGPHLAPSALGKSTPEQINSFVNRFWGLSYRMLALVEAREAHQSTALVEQLRSEVLTWRAGVENVLRRLSFETTSTNYESLQSRLLSTLARLEDRIEETLNSAVGENLTVEESENMYRLLYAHKGVSESLLYMTKLVPTIDWERLREARF